MDLPEQLPSFVRFDSCDIIQSTESAPCCSGAATHQSGTKRAPGEVLPGTTSRHQKSNYPEFPDGCFFFLSFPIRTSRTFRTTLRLIITNRIGGFNEVIKRVFLTFCSRFRNRMLTFKNSNMTDLSFNSGCSVL